jgi:LacI family transcriptional regulator
VPRDISLFGFDGNPLNAYLAPWLSTIEVPYESFGPAAAGVLQDWWTLGRAHAGDIILPFRIAIAASP